MAVLSPILEVRNLHKSFDGLCLFENARFELQAGMIINCLFGKNGSGKTTFFNLLTGHLRPDSGEIIFQNETTARKKPYEIVLSGMVKMWQQPRLFGSLTVLENLTVSAKHHPGEHLWLDIFSPEKVKRCEADFREKAFRVLNNLGIGHLEARTAAGLSIGEQKIVNLGMLWMNDPKLLLLDEPFSGINPTMIEKLSEVLRHFRAEGKSILMIEHKIAKAEAISDNFFQIQDKKIKLLR